MHLSKMDDRRLDWKYAGLKGFQLSNNSNRLGIARYVWSVLCKFYFNYICFGIANWHWHCNFLMSRLIKYTCGLTGFQLSNNSNRLGMCFPCCVNTINYIWFGIANWHWHCNFLMSRLIDMKSLILIISRIEVSP